MLPVDGCDCNIGTKSIREDRRYGFKIGKWFFGASSEEDPDGGVQSLLDQYKTRTQNNPSNYNVDNKVGQFLIDKVSGFTSGALSILGGAADIG